MRNGIVFDLHLNHVLPGAFGALADRFGDFVGFAEVNPDLTFAVTHDHESREAETTAAFDHLGTAVDENHFFEEFRAFVLRRAIVTTAALAAGTTTAWAASTGTTTTWAASAGTTRAASAGTTRAAILACRAVGRRSSRRSAHSHVVLRI